jgi:hypothetical protein
MELVHKSWTMSGLGPRWTTAVWPRAWWRACRSMMHRHYGSTAVATRSRGGRGGCGRVGGALTGDGAVEKRLGDGSKVAVMKTRGGGELRHKRGGWCGVQRGEVGPGCLL